MRIQGFEGRVAVVAGETRGRGRARLERLTTGLHRQFGDRGVAVSCIRIDEVIPTEAVLLLVPDLAASAKSTADGYAGAIIWALQRPPEQIGGRVLGLDDLRSAGALR